MGFLLVLGLLLLFLGLVVFVLYTVRLGFAVGGLLIIDDLAEDELVSC